VSLHTGTHFEDLQCQELWSQTEVKDGLKFISVPQLHSSLGQSLCKALPAFHALTGCDSTRALQGNGKTTALKILVKDNQLQHQISHFNADPAVSNESLISSGAFICSLHNRGGRLTKADEVWYLIFCQKRRKVKNFFRRSKGCLITLKRQPSKRTLGIRRLVAMQNLPSPDGRDWKMEEDNLVPVSMTKEHSPKNIVLVDSLPLQEIGMYTKLFLHGCMFVYGH